MSRLGIDIDTGLVYEGRDGPTHPVWPTPPVCNATLIEKPSDMQRVPVSFHSAPFGWIFVETSFDFGARIRRGRLFQNLGNVSREIVQVEAHPAVHSDLIKAANNAWRVPKNLTVYIECTELLSRPNIGMGARMMLGKQTQLRVGKSSKWNARSDLTQSSPSEPIQRLGSFPNWTSTKLIQLALRVCSQRITGL